LDTPFGPFLPTYLPIFLPTFLRASSPTFFNALGINLSFSSLELSIFVFSGKLLIMGFSSS